MQTKGYRPVPGTEHMYNIQYRYIREVSAKKYDMTFDEVTDCVREFNEGPLIAELEPYRDAVEYVEKLAERGFRFTMITSLSDHPDAYEHRAHNIEVVFQESIGPGEVFEELICLPIGASKQHVLSQWGGTGLFWIEDHFKNAEAGHEVGLKTLLVDTEYNRHYQTDLFPRLDIDHPWRDAYNHIIEHYGIMY
jgi:FMN phosphatase YigB (HAD superfamily)